MTLVFERMVRKEDEERGRNARYRQGREETSEMEAFLGWVTDTPLPSQLKKDRFIWERGVLRKMSSA